MDVGTEIELMEISKTHSNGSKDIKTKAIGKYRIVEFKEVAENKLYGTARVEAFSDQFDPLPKINEEIFELLNQLFKILKIGKPVPTFDESFNMHLIAQKVGLNHEQEYEFLQIDSESKRQIYIYNHLSKLIPVVTEMEKLKEKVKLNGHFKELKPPFF
jgi:transposase-like protein